MDDQTLQQRLEAHRAQLLFERDQFIAQANQKVGEYNGRLIEIDELLQQFGLTTLGVDKASLIVDEQRKAETTPVKQS
jgi:malate synthase